MTVHFQADGPIAVVTLDRPEVKNAIDRPTATALADALRRFDADPELLVAVVTGAHGTFCAGNDLKSMREPGAARTPARRAGRRRPGRTRPACCSASPPSPPSRVTPSRAGSSSRSGATCASPPRTPCSASTAGAGASR